MMVGLLTSLFSMASICGFHESSFQLDNSGRVLLSQYRQVVDEKHACLSCHVLICILFTP